VRPPRGDYNQHLPRYTRGCQPPPRIAFLAVSKAVAAILRNPEVARYARLRGLPLGHRWAEYRNSMNFPVAQYRALHFGFAQRVG
jgi:hypothetical protein